MMQHNLKQFQINRKKQRGATLLGMLIVAAMIVFVALIVMKMVPVYSEFFSVKKVIKAMKSESLGDMSKREIMQSFDRRADTAYIESVKGTDVVVEKNLNGETVISVEYRVEKPIMGNVSVVMDFVATSESN
jgi:competence protein ComGC